MRRELTDADLLAILELRDDGLTMAEIGERYGRTRSAIGGILHRIRAETEASAHDGSMPYGWWRERTGGPPLTRAAPLDDT